MKILLKCPTRSRPAQFLSVLQKYVSLAKQPELLGVCVSCDQDDSSMTQGNVQYSIKNATRSVAWCDIFYGTSTTKIEAVNADMASIPWEWDIVVLVSDDMVPQVKGYDDILRNHMTAQYPDTNGILWVNDGTQGSKLNTITIMGRAMYASFGYIYHPSYKSLFCDTEFTDLCKTSLASKTSYIPQVLIRHEHPGTGFPEKQDQLYSKNQTYWSADMFTYISRKTYEYDWSILIPTISGREQSLRTLLNAINEKRARICPTLRIEVSISFDNREKRIGTKRQELLQAAKGKYSSFVDDDDMITDAYFEDAVSTIKGGFHCCRLRGQMNQYTFTHSIDNRLDMPMCIGDVFIRPPNHLNIILTGVGSLISFKNVSRGEDLDWTIRLAQTGWLQTEYQSDPSRIHYIYNLGDRTIDEGTAVHQRTTTYQTMLNMVWVDGGAIPVARPIDIRKTGLRLGAKGFVSK
jgi:hypothetical protein